MINKILFFTNYIGGYLLYIISALLCLKGNVNLGNIILECALVLRILSIIFLFISKKDTDDIKFHQQYLIIEFLLGIFYLSSVISKITNKEFIVIVIMEGCCLLLSLFYELFLLRKSINIRWEKKSFLRGKFLFSTIVASIFTILSVPCLKTSYMWDTGIYVQGIVANASKYNFTFSEISYALRSHLQLGFDFFYIAIYNILGNNANLIFIGNILLAVVTIYVFGKVIELLIPNILELEYLLSLFIFAFSPLFLGNISSINLDFVMMCYFIWFVYVHMKKFYILQLFLGILLCFSKEPGVILGAGYIGIHMCLDIFLKMKKLFNQNGKLKKLISELPLKRYFMDIIPFLLFVIVFLSKGSVWTSADNKSDNYIMHGFGYIGIGYIHEKMKAVFVLNYSWILWIIIFILLIFTIQKKKEMYSFKSIIMLFFSFFAYIVFNCCYITYLHPRYIICTVFMVSVLLVFFIHYAFEHAIYRKIVLLIVSILLLVQSFSNADIITKSIYNSLPTGKGELISTKYFDKYIYSDANIYNRQFIYWQYSLLNFLDEIEYQANDLLIFPDIQYKLNELSRYCILGLWKEESELFYNPRHKRLDNYPEEGSLVLQTDFYNKEHKEIDTSEYNRIYYIDIGLLTDKKDTTEDFINKYGYTALKKYSTLSWEIIVYTIKE